MAETRLPAKPFAAAASELLGSLSWSSPMVANEGVSGPYNPILYACFVLLHASRALGRALGRR